MSDPTAAQAAVATKSQDLRPLVAHGVDNRGPWIFGGILFIGALGLFSVLEARRTITVTSPATTSNVAAGPDVIGPPPELSIPQYNLVDGVIYDDRPRLSSLPGVEGRFRSRVVTTVPLAPRIVQQAPPAPVEQTRISSSEISFPEAPEVPVERVEEAEQAQNAAGSLDSGRVRATRLASPATTVPQGAVIQAVLETALDSNHPGFARAIVSRDVRSFDGSQILIPRGSRLFGEYKSDLASGQNRALVQWLRLTRPDGVQISIDSPAADPLGRAGVKGTVNSHFFARFGSAILKSILDIGVNAASRSVTDGTVIVGLPGSTQAISGIVQPERIAPTLTVKQGSGVSVFVARDLDFSNVEP